MILLRTKRLLFIKGAKVAGTSIEVFLAGHAGPDDIVTPIEPPPALHQPRNFARRDGAPAYYNHIDARTVRDMLGTEYFGSLRRFGVVRNPFEKVKSTFAMQYVRNDGRYDMDRAIADTWSEREKYCDENGELLLTDVVRYEELRGDLRRLLSAVGIEFDRLDIREKGEYRKSCQAEPIMEPRHVERIADKFQWEFRNFYPGATGGGA